MIYLASPYTHQNKAIEEERYTVTMEVTAILISRGLPIFSPIVHCHPMAQQFDMPTDAKSWELYNGDFIRKASSMYVLTIAGWKESKGVTQEIILANRLAMPVHYVDRFGHVECEGL